MQESKEEKDGKCPNCRRDVRLTKHHLIPQVKGGKHGNTMWLCKDCHGTLHMLHENNFLRDYRSTEMEVLADPQMIKFGKFAFKQGKHIKKRAPKHRRK